MLAIISVLHLQLGVDLVLVRGTVDTDVQNSLASSGVHVLAGLAFSTLELIATATSTHMLTYLTLASQVGIRTKVSP